MAQVPQSVADKHLCPAGIDEQAMDPVVLPVGPARLEAVCGLAFTAQKGYRWAKLSTTPRSPPVVPSIGLEDPAFSP